MHASGKIFMGIGFVLLLIGGGMLWWGADTAELDLEEESSYIGTGTGTWDFDGGDWYFVYVKTSVDCESFTMTMTNTTDSTTTNDWSGDNANKWDCTDVDGTDDPDGFMAIGTIDASHEGEYTMTSSDKIYVAGIGDALADAGAGILAGLGSICFFGGGICLLLLGLVLGLTINDKSQTVVVQGGGGGMVGMGAPVGAPMAAGGAVPVMGAPAAAAPMAAPVAAAPMAAPVAAPDPGQEYYNSLLTQGYDSASAAQYTAQHYPGFQP